MASKSTDPWSKKSKAGMKIMNKTFNTAFKVGSVVAHEVNNSTKTAKSNYPKENNPAQKTPKGCLPGLIVFAIGIGLTFLIKSDVSFFSLILIFLIWGAVAFVVSLLFSITPSAEPAKQDNKIDYSESDISDVNTITQIIISEKKLEEIELLLSEKSNEEKKKLLIRSFEKSVDEFLNDGLFSLDEEDRISAFMDLFKLSQTDLNNRGYFEKIVQASILRTIMNGNIPESKFRVTDGTLPFMMSKDERLIWLFQNVSYYEDSLNRQFVGRSSGVSIKIANGLYYRTSAFKGQPVITRELKLIGNGMVGFTNKNLYYYSNNKSLKIPYNKIISLSPFEDGIGIHKEGANSHPQIFKNLNGWFVYNLVTNLSKM